MGGGKKNENENENGRKREFATDPRSKRAREKIRRSGTPLTPIKCTFMGLLAMYPTHCNLFTVGDSLLLQPLR